MCVLLRLFIHKHDVIRYVLRAHSMQGGNDGGMVEVIKRMYWK